ncbi:MAG TPA: hypothetical protein PKA00_07575 [Saprospiraceae bacterium]|nr:hypothetical protein [Saprospiraceae bacterium]HMQ82750.1 hypothetical protein [Saprospiraceae bacterium]
MSNNYHFNINPQLPERDAISRYKDFDGLLAKFEAQEQKKYQRQLRPVALRRLLYVGSAVAAAIALLLLFMPAIMQTDSTPGITAAEYFASQPYVKAPLQEIQVAYQEQVLNANDGGIYEFPSGSRLIVPSAAFMNDRGQLIQGEVRIFYREILDFQSIFLSGISMYYDSAGQKYLLESAGMVEVIAEQNGERLKLASGKSIDIELVSEIQVTDPLQPTIPTYKVYQLQETERAWQYQTNNQMQVLDDILLDANDPAFHLKLELVQQLESVNAEQEKRKQALEASLPALIKPLKPERAHPDRPTLELDFTNGSVQVDDSGNEQAESELEQLQRMYQGVIWQVAENSPVVDPKAFSVAWESMSIKPLNNRDYELLLIHPNNQVKLIVNPVLLGADYQKALQRYQEALNRYEADLAERRQSLSVQYDAIDREAKAKEAAILDNYRRTVASESGKSEVFGRKIVNRFQANSLGIWLCAYPQPLSQMSDQHITFRDQFGNAYNDQFVYLASSDENTLRKYYAGDVEGMNLNHDADQLLWLVTPEGKIAIADAQELQKVAESGSNTYEINLNLIDKTILTEQDIRTILQF